MIKMYELTPIFELDGRKSFYGKAKIVIDDNGNETLYSYDTAIITRNADGTLVKHWHGWTATTGRHIKAFCGLNKAEYETLLEDVRYQHQCK